MNAPIPLEQAQDRLLALRQPLEAEMLPVRSGLDRNLAEPLIARRTQPPTDLSAMDGYAIAGNAPWVIVGESRGGTPFEHTLEGGQAVRIATGAHMPQGADRVLIQENAAIDNANVLTATAALPSPGQNVRRKGLDFTDGKHLLDAGATLGPAHIALALSAGHAALKVHRRPRIALIESGNELSGDPEKCTADHIPATNNAMIAAMAAPLAAQILSLGPIADDKDAIIAAFDTAQDVDVIVTSGGASVGDHDLVRPALESWGATREFWRVAMKPGKPLLVAQKNRQIILGLPGNPVSSFATTFLFLLPLLRHLSGASAKLPSRLSAKAGTPLPRGSSRREFLRAIWDGKTIVPVGEQDSSALHALTQANALIERTEHCDETKAGTFVPFYHLRNGGIA